MRRIRRALAPTLALAVLSALVACGDDSDDGPDLPSPVDGSDVVEQAADAAAADRADDVDVCELVTEEDIEAAMPGIDVALDSSDPGSCTYATDDIPIVVVTVMFDRGGLVGTDFDMFVGMADGFVGEASEGGGITEISGLGDRAAEVDGIVPMLFVATDDDLLTVSVIGDETGDAAEKLARTALSRL